MILGFFNALDFKVRRRRSKRYVTEMLACLHKPMFENTPDGPIRTGSGSRNDGLIDHEGGYCWAIFFH
jgi:hypothetical protein